MAILLTTDKLTNWMLEQKMKLKVISLLVASAFLFACTENPNRDVGTVTGAIVGGVVGNQIGKGSGRAWATSIGMIAGAVIGGNIGAAWTDKTACIRNKPLRHTLTTDPKAGPIQTPVTAIP